MVNIPFKNCEECGEVFYKKPTTSKKDWAQKSKYCSCKCSLKNTTIARYAGMYKGAKGVLKANSGSFKKGQPPWNKGLKGYRAGELNNMWKGDNVGYSGVHAWVSKVYGKPCECECCETTDKNKTYQWANISGEYKRLRLDWKRLCVLCHKKLDAVLLPRGEAVKTSKLNSEKVKLIRTMAEGFGWTCKKVCRFFTELYRVSDTAIRYVLSYKTWRHV